MIGINFLLMNVFNVILIEKMKIEAEYKSKIKALDEEASADIIANCPIKVGDVYVTENNNAWGS